MPGGAVGFIGLGIMGVPMAANLVRSGADVVVWARNSEASTALVSLGARAADDVAGVFEAANTVVLMLRDEAAVDAVLARESADFERLVSNHTIVQMGTFTTEFSAGLAEAVGLAGGRYVEAPVSGSRGPATDGTLVAMVAGDHDAIDDVEPILRAMCGQLFRCGPVPTALSTKLAVNNFLVTMVAGLAETFHFAKETGVDPHVLQAALDAGPMSSAVSRGKTAKLLAADLSPQAAVTDVVKNALLVEDAAIAAGIAHPLISASRELFQEAAAQGLGALDMIAVVGALEMRTRAHRSTPAPHERLQSAQVAPLQSGSKVGPLQRHEP